MQSKEFYTAIMNILDKKASKIYQLDIERINEIYGNR